MKRYGARGAVVVASLCVAVAAVWLYGHPPDGGPGACVFHYSTSLYCPGCGGTRAAYDLLHLRAGDAFRHNPILFVLAPLVVYWGGRVGWQALRHNRWQEPPLPRAVTYTVTVLVITYFVVRNLPWWPFTCLRP